MINAIVNFFRSIYYTIYMAIFDKSLKKQFFNNRKKIIQLMFKTCESEYERLTCADICTQLNIFHRQMANKNIQGCVFTVNSMIGLRDKVIDNEKLFSLVNCLCVFYSLILRSFGIDAVYETSE